MHSQRHGNLCWHVFDMKLSSDRDFMKDKSFIPPSSEGYSPRTSAEGGFSCLSALALTLKWVFLPSEGLRRNFPSRRDDTDYQTTPSSTSLQHLCSKAFSGIRVKPRLTRALAMSVFASHFEHPSRLPHRARLVCHPPVTLRPSSSRFLPLLAASDQDFKTRVLTH